MNILNNTELYAHLAHLCCWRLLVSTTGELYFPLIPSLSFMVFLPVERGETDKYLLWLNIPINHED